MEKIFCDNCKKEVKIKITLINRIGKKKDFCTKQCLIEFINGI